MLLTNALGRKIAEYTYGAYGELLSGDTSLTSFLYNGRCGVSTDENGLYYMRQRYYNPEIKRFVNQDILTGSLSDSQSLNRYSYVQGNPVSYTDPFGLSPIKSMFTNGNVVHSILGLAGCIPGLGIIASLIDAGLYFGEGNMVMFGACLVDAALGFVPFGAGYLIKMGSKSVRLLNVVIKGSKLARNSIVFYRNTKNFAFSAADFYIRHEGTFFTNDFKWGLADVGDIMSMAMSGTGMLQSGAGIYKSVTDLSAFLYASGIKDDIKNAFARLKNGIKNTVGSEWNRFALDNRGAEDLDALAGFAGIKGKAGGSKSNYILFNKTHKDSMPKPKGTGPNGGKLQSHHGIQQEWAKNNLSQYDYDANLAPTVTIENGTGYPHTIITNLQKTRREARIAAGKGKWSSSLQEELSYIVSDFRTAGFSDATICDVLEQQYKMLDKLNVPYERIKF